MEEISPNIFSEKINSFLNGEISNVKKGIGSFITFDVGEQSKTYLDGYPMHIWIYLCDWRLFHNDKELLNCDEESNEKVRYILDPLNGKKLTGIKISTDRSLLIDISGGYTFQLYKNAVEYDDDDDLLVIYLDDGNIISFSDEHGFYLE